MITLLSLAPEVKEKLGGAETFDEAIGDCPRILAASPSRSNRASWPRLQMHDGADHGAAP